MKKHVRIFWALALCPLLSQIAYAQTAPKPFKINPNNVEPPNEFRAALRIGYPPLMPPSAQRSGFCCLETDIDKKGRPHNIRATFCTEQIFSKPSRTAMAKWRFAPAGKKTENPSPHSTKSIPKYLD